MNITELKTSTCRRQPLNYLQAQPRIWNRSGRPWNKPASSRSDDCKVRRTDLSTTVPPICIVASVLNQSKKVFNSEEAVTLDKAGHCNRTIWCCARAEWYPTVRCSHISTAFSSSIYPAKSLKKRFQVGYRLAVVVKPVFIRNYRNAWYTNASLEINFFLIKKPKNRLLQIFFTWFYIK